MTRGRLRRGASPRIDRRAPRVRVRARARTYVHPLWHAESQLRGHCVRPARPVSRSSAPRDVPNATTNACRSTTKQTRAPHTPCRTIPDEIRGGARAGASARSRSALRDRSARPRSDASSPRRRRRVRLGARALWRAQRRTRPNSLLGNHFNRKESDKTASARRKCRLLVCSAKEFSSFSNRRAVNSGERLSSASLIARTVTVEHHGGPHADAQRADDRTCGGSSRRAARFVAETRGHAPRSNARRGASCQIFFVSVAAICAFRG